MIMISSYPMYVIYKPHHSPYESHMNSQREYSLDFVSERGTPVVWICARKHAGESKWIEGPGRLAHYKTLTCASKKECVLVSRGTPRGRNASRHEGFPLCVEGGLETSRYPGH